MLDRLMSAFVAVCLALLVWLYARSRDQEILDHVPVPVDVILPAGRCDQYCLDVSGTSQVMATFTGPPTRIREVRALIQRDQLRVAVNLNIPAERLKDSRVYETILVEPADIRTPSGVSTTMLPGRNQ